VFYGDVDHDKVDTLSKILLCG